MKKRCARFVELSTIAIISCKIQANNGTYAQNFLNGHISTFNCHMIDGDLFIFLPLFNIKINERVRASLT